MLRIPNIDRTHRCSGTTKPKRFVRSNFKLETMFFNRFLLLLLQIFCVHSKSPQFSYLDHVFFFRRIKTKECLLFEKPKGTTTTTQYFCFANKRLREFLFSPTFTMSFTSHIYSSVYLPKSLFFHFGIVSMLWIWTFYFFVQKLIKHLNNFATTKKKPLFFVKFKWISCEWNSTDFELNWKTISNQKQNKTKQIPRRKKLFNLILLYGTWHTKSTPF